jgi:hypothetical protein
MHTHTVAPLTIFTHISAAVNFSVQKQKKKFSNSMEISIHKKKKKEQKCTHINTHGEMEVKIKLHTHGGECKTLSHYMNAQFLSTTTHSHTHNLKTEMKVLKAANFSNSIQGEI